MSESGPSGGTILAALFMIVAGLCLALLGGGCTFVLLSEYSVMPTGGGTQMLPLLLISLVVLAGGLGMIWVAVKLLRGGYNR